MKRIELKRLELRNFKGIRELDINFKDVTNIYGKNDSGKSTIVDAFTWLLFGIKATGETNFNIKTLKENKEPIHGLDHSVTGILEVDGKKWTLKKTYREKWVKKRGSTQKEQDGHEAIYEINDVPITMTEYNDKIESFLDVNTFKLITTPHFFSVNLTWDKRRAILLAILGDITDEQVISRNESLRPLLDHLDDFDIATLLRQTKASKTKINTELKSIPTRIDETSRSIKEWEFEEIEALKNQKEKELEEIQEAIRGNSGNDAAKLKIKDSIYDLKNKMRDFEYNYRNTIAAERRPLLEVVDNMTAEKSGLERTLITQQSYRSTYKCDLDVFDKKMDKLKSEYESKFKEKLDVPEHINACPTCKRAFDSGDIQRKIEELEGNFKLQKARDLERINKLASQIKEDKEVTTEKIHTLNDEITQLESKIKNVIKEIEMTKKTLEEFDKETVRFMETEEYQKLESDLAQLEIDYRADDGATVRKELKDAELQIKTRIAELSSQLAQKQQNVTLRQRVSELEEQLQETSQRYADLEKIEFLCEEFTRKKVELLEAGINEKFKYISFKLFDVQANGGLKETCEATVNGVPYAEVNTASKLNAGLDIINTLNETYQVTAPVFLDNRESVTKIIPTKSQVINLYVDENEKILKVEE